MIMANLKAGINEMLKEATPQKENKYNLKPTSEIRPFRSGSMSQEISSAYENLSDTYGVDMNDLVYGDKGFMKTKYPQGFPDFKGDVVYNNKYWDEFEKWAKENRGVDFDDRRWERYKVDPDYFERKHTPEIIKQVREYGKSVDPKHAIHKRPLDTFVW